MLAVLKTEASMRAFTDDLEVRRTPLESVPELPQPRDRPTYTSGDIAAATAWLVFYALVITVPLLSGAIVIASR
jgi:cytochrome b561